MFRSFFFSSEYIPKEIVKNYESWNCKPESIRILEKAVRYALWRFVDREAFEGWQLKRNEEGKVEEKRK